MFNEIFPAKQQDAIQVVSTCHGLLYESLYTPTSTSYGMTA